MKITIIGSTGLNRKMKNHAKKLREEGNRVRMPAFDNLKGCDELQVCECNLKNIKWADEVHIIWDCRSTGTIFDFGMIFALHKPVKLLYLEKKTFRGLMEKYEAKKMLEKGGK